MDNQGSKTRNTPVTLIATFAVACLALLLLRVFDQLSESHPFDSEGYAESPTLPVAQIQGYGHSSQHNHPGLIDTDESSMAEPALESKASRVEALALERTDLTAEQRQQINSDVMNNFYIREGAEDFRQKLRSQLSETFGEEEAEFRISIIDAASDWETVKELVRLRETQLASNGMYNSVLMEIGLGTGSITAEEIESLVNAGTPLPEEAIFQMASQGNVDAISDLSERGLLVNPTYQHLTLGLNAVGAYIRHASSYPDRLTPDEARTSILKLVGLGVEPVPGDGTFDALDFALQHANSSNVELKTAMVNALLESGVRPGKSHLEALNHIVEEDVRVHLAGLIVGGAQ